MEAHDLADRLIGVASEAGRLQMRHYSSGIAFEQKSDASPVTAADRESERVIVRALERIAPDTPVVAEEAMSEGRSPKIGRQFFLVDPLDGTREFISGRGEFTINIALIETGTPIFGLVYAPALDQLFVTLAKDQAFEAHMAPGAQNTRLDELELSQLQGKSPDMDALQVVASRSHLDPQTEEYLAGFKVAERMSAGSSLKFCLLARGQADLYPRFGRTMEWDTAAGHAVLHAAGGTVLTVDGEPLAYGKKGAGFANPGFVAWGSANSATVS